MASDGAKTFMVEDAQIIFRNFSGKEGMYNKEGDRNFAVIIPDADMAAQLDNDGWNVKWLQGREEGDPDVAYVQISVNFDNRPPNVVMITQSGRNNLTEDTVGSLDWADIKNVDLIARGYDWTVNGKSGTKAYLKSMFVTIEEDALERKYSQIEGADRG